MINASTYFLEESRLILFQFTTIFHWCILGKMLGITTTFRNKSVRLPESLKWGGKIWFKFKTYSVVPVTKILNSTAFELKVKKL